MSREPQFEMEPERYESYAGPAYRFELQRRDLLKSLGGGLLVVGLGRPAAGQETAGVFHGPPSPPSPRVDAWLHIDGKGQVTVFTGKVEVGQNARTSLTAAVAEELGAPPESVHIVMGDTDRTPWDIGTLGSQTTPNMLPQIRRAAAAARSLLPAGEWAAIDFAAIADRRVLLDAAIGDAKTVPASHWQVMGKRMRKVAGADFVTGKHRYTSDRKHAGMLHGKVIRPDRFHARLIEFDGSAAEKMPDVSVVRDGDFAGVTAPSAAALQAAASVVKAKWKSTEQTSSATLHTDLKAGVALEKDEALEKALAGSWRKLERTYTVSYIAQAPLEPRAAIAEWTGDKLTVWTGTQRPFAVREELAQAFRIREENVRVLVPDTGSGYGGKHTGESAIEAARLAKAVRKPVKLVWTREEEFTWAYFRPAGVIDVRGGVDEDGHITAWDFHNYNSGRAAIQTQYEIPRKRIEYHATRSPLRQGSYRGLAATANVFARESHIDELASTAGIEPLEFRLRNLREERLRAVFEAVAQRSGWGRRKSGNGSGFGIAGGFEKGGYIATCAEVEGRPARVVRLTAAFECGAVVNPYQLEMQIEGCLVMGLGGALFEEVDFANGRILNPHFSQYRVPRFRDIPEIDIVVLDRPDLASAGGSETPIVAVAPAIANAIFAATGERTRRLPLTPGAAAGKGAD